ncbi:hypothetical protein HMPREF9727_01339 [Treponema denticola MYR-T]|uniref:HTH cro/C1-type domain-containing protein n=1 Tax=Treponema denticola H1-T TaxID=999431 RepID=M2C7Q4_TREDN|nr:helix-turn-helix transcriptional regulator [Treponema denticola]EMB29548.1 hypothetical protein HMPREF9727_01339 [Treponema denticola MYR-T]EMB29668.1 hypothetical protein HMPREF9725_01695 [Treponema denticola H1-T]EMB40516.1 hypothetical protein HMPREF9722_01486 [Treponema denticola ATCC 33520]
MNTSVFWDNIKTLIKRSNTTQRGLALKCGFSSRSIETWIASNQLPDVFQAYTIAQNLGVPLESLVSDEKSDFKPSINRIRGLLKDIEKELDNI